MAFGFGWTVADQGLATLSNFAITVAVARAGGSEVLGRFAIAYAAYLLILGFYRSLIAEPLMAQRARQDGIPERSALTLTLLFGVASGTILGLVGLGLGRGELILMAVAVPIVLLQDILRYQELRRQRPRNAAMLDAVWLAGSALTWPVMRKWPTVDVAVACWGTAALLSLVVGWLALRPTFIALERAREWWRVDTRGLAKPLFLDGVFRGISTQGTVFILGAVVGADLLGVMRAGQVYFNSFMIANAGFGAFLVPRLAQRSEPPTARLAALMSVGVAAVAALACAVIVIVEPFLHVLLYAGSIAVPMTIMVPLAAQTLLTAASGPWVAVASAARRTQSVARSRLYSTVAGVPLLLWCVHSFGLVGALWAAVAQTALLLLWLCWYVTRDLSSSVVAMDQTTGSCDHELAVGPSSAPSKAEGS